jgi:putative ABC transport system ATP-binding protein
MAGAAFARRAPCPASRFDAARLPGLWRNARPCCAPVFPPAWIDRIDEAFDMTTDPSWQLAPAAPRPLFAARGLTKVYQMGEVRVQALRGVDLDLFGGEFVVLLGPSGSGKSSLLNILGGLDTPSGGTLRYAGEELRLDDDAAMTRYRRAEVGFVFQFYNLIPSLTARENVAIVTDIAEHPMTPEDALARVGLGDRMDHFPTQMSGGEQQRVAIARAVAKRPQVLLCDEPTGALDAQTGVVVLEVIDQISRELGTTTVLITHNAVIASMADRVVYFGDGQVVRIVRNARKARASELHW